MMFIFFIAKTKLRFIVFNSQIIEEFFFLMKNFIFFVLFEVKLQILLLQFANSKIFIDTSHGIEENIHLLLHI